MDLSPGMQELTNSTQLNCTVDLLKLIFNLALSMFNQAYKLRSAGLSQAAGKIIKETVIKEDFERMGLVEFS